MSSKSVTEGAGHPSAPSRGRLSWSQSRTLGNVSAPVTARRDGVKGADARSRWGPLGGLQGLISSSTLPRNWPPGFFLPKDLLQSHLNHRAECSEGGTMRTLILNLAVVGVGVGCL